MTVMLTGTPAIVRAAFRPPKPAPTITTRCATGCAVLPFILLPITLLLYKIQRDGNGLQKFGCGRASGVGAMARPVNRGFIFCDAPGAARIHDAIGAAAGRCRNRLAYSDWTIDSGDACGFPRRSVFLNDWSAVVCLGVAVRRAGGAAGG